MFELVQLGFREAIWVLLVLLVAAYVRGLTGFGFSAVTVAGLAFVVGPVEAVTIALIYEVASSAVQAPSVWKDIHWSRFGALLAPAVVGNPLGVWVLTTADEDLLRLLVFAAVLVLTAGLLTGWSTRTQHSSLAVFFTVGLVAGIVNGATALSGLVIVLAMSLLNVPPMELRATLIAYFFAANLVVLVLLGLGSDLEVTDGWRALFGLPIVCIGVVAGSREFAGISAEKFRHLTLWLLVSIAVVGIVRLGLPT